MKTTSAISFFICCCLVVSCTNNKTNFDSDLQFLQKYDSVIVLTEGSASVIVSPKYQAKVFTSSSDGSNSFGWINYQAFNRKPDPHMNAFGGENRLWLGPEGGKFSLFFDKDAKMEYNNWKTPAPFDSEAWQVLEKNDKSVSLQKEALLTNYKGTVLNIRVKRSISILGLSAINQRLDIAPDGSVKTVGFQTNNTLTNTGNIAWTDTTGMPCLWMLDMFPPSDQTTIVIPYNEDPHPATTDYFGEISKDRIKYSYNTVFFKADGKSRGKLGIDPTPSKNISGSYDADKKVLTITLFDIDNTAKYLNQEWNTTKDSFSGDVINAYNDGPLADGKQMGPFYELESVSPAAFLKPGESLTHKHAVFHFSGPEEGLNRIAEKVLGVTIEQIKNAFK